MLYKPRTVVVIDDDAAVRDSLKMLFEMDGIRVSAYASGTAFVEDDADMDAVDCFVIDCRMPGIQGVDLAEKLRAEGARQPIVLIAAVMLPDVTKRAARLSGVSLIEKPLSDDELIRTIEHMLDADGRPH